MNENERKPIVLIGGPMDGYDELDRYPSKNHDMVPPKPCRRECGCEDSLPIYQKRSDRVYEFAGYHQQKK